MELPCQIQLHIRGKKKIVFAQYPRIEEGLVHVLLTFYHLQKGINCHKNEDEKSKWASQKVVFRWLQIVWILSHIKEVGKGREARMRHDSTHLPDSNMWWSLNMRCTYLHLVYKISWEISQRFFPRLKSLLICINSNLCWQGDCLECLPSDADTGPFPDPSVPWTCAAWVVAAPSIKMLHYKYHVSKKRRFPSHCKW